MNLIITMAGAGERFKRAGYTVPKYRIEARGRLLFDWSMDSLRDYFPHSGKTVFLVRKEENARDFLLARCQTLDIAHPEIVELEKLTDGQATTALLGVARCTPEELDCFLEA